MSSPAPHNPNIAIHSFQIIEHLISLTELLELGFDEIKVSDALLKFDNDREKALDYLIS